jgi:hypothetical protein
MRNSNRTIFAFLITTLALAASACSAQSPGASSSSGSQAAPAATSTPDGQPETPGPALSPGEGTAADDCNAQMVAASGAQNTMVLLWETIDYQVESDADWKEQVNIGQIDVPAYRAAADLVADLPDAAYPGRPELWSAYSGDAVALAALLEQAATSGTPFADGIGDQIVGLAEKLRKEGMWGIYGAVDAMCDDPADDLAAAGVDELIITLTPPNSTETYRLTSPTFSTFDFDSTESVEALTSFFDNAIPKAGWKIFFSDSLDPGRYWDITGPGSPGRGTIKVLPAESGSGTTVSISFTG